MADFLLFDGECRLNLITYAVDALAGRVVADLLEVDCVDGAGDLLLAPEPPRRLLKGKRAKKTTSFRG